MADAQYKQRNTLKKQKALEISLQIERIVKEFSHQQSLYETIGKETIRNLDLVYDGVIQNFQKRNLSLIEFTDIVESYIESTMLLNEVKKQIILSGITLNYVINEQVF